MKVPLHVVHVRRERLAQVLGRRGYLSVRELGHMMGVSEATVRRDLTSLAKENVVKRTYGGAVSDFDERFPSFRERQRKAAATKALIGKRAAELIEPGSTCFLDSGTTIHAVAEAFFAAPRTPVSFVTCNLPAGELLAAIDSVRVFQVAGQLYHRQSVLLGEMARRSIDFWRFDTAFLSAEGWDEEGIWNTTPEIVDQQLAVIRRSARVVFCLGADKLKHRAEHRLVKWSEVDRLVTDATPAQIARKHIPLERARTIFSGDPPCQEPHRALPPSPEASDDQLPVHYL
jgi:DeoR/GlpR family transcriptional regulator of sugar metabolism